MIRSRNGAAMAVAASNKEVRMIEPYSWQLQAIERQTRILRENQVCMVTSSTGTGKTICALQTVKDLNIPYAVVAPKNTKSAWA